MTARTRRTVCGVAWLLAALVCWLAAGCNSRLTQAAQSGTQLRDISIDAARAQTLIAVEEDTELPVAFTLWQQNDKQTVENKELGRTAQASTVLLKGDSALVLACGLNLPSGDTAGCLLDRETAYALFGDANAGGTLTFDGRDYLVRGVFDLPAGIVLLQGPPETVFSALTLAQGADADDFAARHALSATTVSLQALGMWADFFATLPAWTTVLALCLALRRMAMRERLYPVRRALLLAAAMLFLCLFVWTMRGTIPFSRDFVPTRWSDFEFWQRTFTAWQTQMTLLFTMKKYSFDLFRLDLFARSALWGIGGALCCHRFLRGYMERRATT